MHVVLGCPPYMMTLCESGSATPFRTRGANGRTLSLWKGIKSKKPCQASAFRTY